MAEFLRVLAASHSVAMAARSVGMSRQSAYQLRARLKGEPFDLAWETAFQHSYDALHQAALERAIAPYRTDQYHWKQVPSGLEDVFIHLMEKPREGVPQ